MSRNPKSVVHRARVVVICGVTYIIVCCRALLYRNLSVIYIHTYRCPSVGCIDLFQRLTGHDPFGSKTDLLSCCCFDHDSGASGSYCCRSWGDRDGIREHVSGARPTAFFFLFFYRARLTTTACGVRLLLLQAGMLSRVFFVLPAVLLIVGRCCCCA